MKKIRILYVHGGKLNRGGTEAFMMNTFRTIRDNFEIDFVVHGFERGVYDQEIESKGGRIFYIPIKSKDYFGNLKALNRIIKEGCYDIVHAHLNAMNGPVLRIAEKYRVPVRISHSHASEHYTENPVKLFLNERAMRSIPKYATDLFACSKKAGDFLYGSNPYSIWYNAIDLDSFAYNESIREQLKNKYELTNNLVFGHIGRFNFQKNHEQLIRIFKEIYEKNNEARLFLIGEGELEEQTRELVNHLGLNKVVRFQGLVDNVPEFLSMFDVFLLPSVFEGLPYVLVEAQANGLLVLASNNIDEETKIDDKFYFLDPNDIDSWIKTIDQSLPYFRVIDKTVFVQRGFDLKMATEKLERYYLSRIDNAENQS